jgi:carbohydrate kinase (thermoresistant glucokinase family)
MTAPRLIIMGVSGCGKSTVGERLAQRLGVPFLEGDALHPPHNVALMAAGTPLTDADRVDWLDAIASRLSALHAGEGIVVSCSALKRVYRDRLRAATSELQFVHLHGDHALLAARLGQREGHYMPPALLISQLETLETPSTDEAALSLDIAEPVDRLVAQIEQHLHLNPA